MTKWTENQKQAIESKGSVLVSASAGTGKTAVLTEKVANSIIKDKIGIEHILVMTFSAAAAEEMKGRIEKKLRGMLKDENISAGEKSHIWHELKNFHSANIKTIHSFCNDIVKTYFYKIGMDPSVSVGDNFDISILKLEAAKQALHQEYYLTEEEFMALDNYIDGTDTFENVIIRTYDKMMSFPQPMEWLENAIDSYKIQDNILPEHLKNMLLKEFNNAIDNYEIAIMELDAFENPKMEKNIEIMEKDVSILQDVVKKLESNDISAIEPTTFNEFAQTIRFPAKTNEYDFIKNLRNKAKDNIIAKYKKTKFSLQEQIDRMKEMYPMLEKFQDIIKEYDGYYTNLKREKNIIDFNDMEKYACEILQDDVIANEFTLQFAKVFIDEYQDTSPVQEAIINKISREDNRFFVGDLKQSIYGFRASDPLLFKSRSETYKSTTKGKVISLSNNFRSTQNVLDCSNDVFKNISKNSKDLSYDDDDTLKHGRLDDMKCNPVVVQTIPAELKDMTGLSGDEIEIYNIVNTIKKEVGNPIYDHELGEYRPATYGDIVISCRKLTGLTDTLSDIFKEQNIPFFIERAGNLLDTAEVQILINLIGLAANTRNDIKLISVIHAGLFGFTDENLMDIRLVDKKKSIAENIYTLAETETETGMLCNKLLSFIGTIRYMETYSRLSDIVNYMLEETRYFDIFTIQEDGKQKHENIKLFQKIVGDFENKSTLKIKGFLSYLDKIQETGEQIDEAKIVLNTNSIRVTTIHKSKGLEYPIEILAFMGKAFSTMDKRANIIIDRNAGIGFRYYNNDDRRKGKSLQRTYVETIASEKLVEEEMRLLYVAMTRAQEKLYIQATEASKDLLEYSADCKNMFDWILNTITVADEDGLRKIKTDNLNGSWEVEEVQLDQIIKFTEAEADTIIVDVAKEYALPFIPEENDMVEENDLIPVSVSSSRLSEIKDASMESITGIFKMPSFSEKTKLNTAQIGTITHEFMKQLDLEQSLTMDNLREQAFEMIENGNLTKEELDVINLKNIERIFETTVGKEVKAADEHLKEKTMNILKTASDLAINQSEDEVLIRCIVDLIYKKDGKYYLVDYKTDRFKDANDVDEMAEKIQRHKEQISLYREAFEKIYNQKIEKCYLMFLDIAKPREVIF